MNDRYFGILLAIAKFLFFNLVPFFSTGSPFLLSLQFSWTVIVVFLSGFAHKLFHLMPWWQKLFHSTKITIIIITPRSIYWVFQNCLSLLNWWNGFSSMFSIQKISTFSTLYYFTKLQLTQFKSRKYATFPPISIESYHKFSAAKNRYLFFIWRYAQKIFNEIK